MRAFVIDFKTLAALVVLVVSSFALADGVTYTYDSLGRITSTTYANGAAVQYAYDANGNRTTLSITAPVIQPQTINFGTAPTVVVGGIGTVSANGSASGNPVTFSSTTTGVCTISGSTVTGLAVGTCTIAANQAGNANYNAAVQATESFNVTLPLFALNISNANIPFGTVSSNVGGVACGSTCSANFASGTKVILTAIPISGYQFTGWGGACRGYGNSCIVTTTNAAQNVTANFAPFKVHQPIWKRVIVSIVNKGG